MTSSNIRRVVVGVIIVIPAHGSKRAKRIVHGFELRRLRTEFSGGPRTTSSWGFDG